MVNTALTIINILLTTALFTRITNVDDHIAEHINRMTHSIKGLITVSTQDTINAIVAQLGKAAQEIQAKIADLNVQIENAGVADQVNLDELTAAAQALDDIVPDAVTNEPPF